jgi:hypothetical protein
LFSQAQRGFSFFSAVDQGKPASVGGAGTSVPQAEFFYNILK